MLGAAWARPFCGWMGNLCDESNKDVLQIGDGIPRSDHKPESGLQKHACTENSLYFSFSVKEEQKPVQTSPHYGFQRRLGRTVAWRYNDLLIEKKAKITFCSQAVLCCKRTLAWNGLKMQRIYKNEL